MAYGCLIDMLKPDWKYTQTLQRRIRITRTSKDSHVDAVDLEDNLPLCLNAAVELDLDRVKRAKIYQATIKVYEAEFTAELERQLLESAMDDLGRLRAIQAMKASGQKPTKYELVALKR
jgi:hypothetical protein